MIEAVVMPARGQVDGGRDALLLLHQLDREQDGGDGEDGGESRVGEGLGQPGGEEGVTEEVMDQGREAAADRIAAELDRRQDQEDEPEIAAHEGHAAAQGSGRRPVLELDDRAGEAEPDEGEDARDEAEQYSDRDDRDENQVDDDQPAVVEAPGPRRGGG